jgi:hypothetical protein
MILCFCTGEFCGVCVCVYIYCDGLLKALRYGTRKPRETRSRIELRLLSSEGYNDHDNRGTIEDIDSKATHTETGFRYNG